MKHENASLAQLRERREELETQMIELDELTADEVTPEQSRQIIELNDQIEAIERQIEDAEKVDAAKRAAARFRRQREQADKPRDTVQGQAPRFSWSRFIMGAVNHRHEGLEEEMRAEGLKEARDAKHMTSVENPLPSAFLQMRGSIGATDSQNTDTQYYGQETISKDLGPLIAALRPNPIINALGGTMLTGLTAPLDMPKQTDKPTATWRKERNDDGKTETKFDTISLAPHGLSAWTQFTKELLMQSSISIDSFIRSELENAIERKLNYDFVHGVSGSGQPAGLAATLDPSDDYGLDGAISALNYAKIIEFWEKLRTANAEMTDIAWLTSPAVVEKLVTTPKITGTDSLTIMESPTAALTGFRVVTSNHAKKDSSTDNYLVLGDWRQAVIANWGGLDVVVDPFTLANFAAIKINIHTWWDYAFLHKNSFAVAKRTA